MTTPVDLSGTISTGATNPAQAAQDGLSAQQQPLPDVIASDKYLAAKAAGQAPPWGIVIGKITSPGAQGRSRGCFP